MKIQMNKAILLLGTNVGERKKNLSDARHLLSSEIGPVDACSSLYETQAWGNTEQEAFLNQVLVVRTEHSAREVMERILAIERKLGRERTAKWAPRVIDIDILFYENEILDEPGLQIPHPFLHQRRFTLVPLAELIPHYIHPVLQKSIGQLLRETEDILEVVKVDGLNSSQ